MTQTVSAMFDRADDARRAVQQLEDMGVPHHDISLVANNARGEHGGVGERAAFADRDDARDDDRAAEAGEDAGKGAGLGAALGGAGGLLAGLGVLAIPGLGPVVAAGWLVSTAVGALGGAAIGAATGGLVGALTHAGVPEEDAHVYAEGVRRGGALVSARVEDTLAGQAQATLDGAAVDVASRREAYRQEGWTRFDPDAPAYTTEQIAAESDRYRQV